MKPTDTSEKGLESIIVASLVEEAGYVQGDPQEYDREHAVDLVKLLQFLAATQSDTYEALGIDDEATLPTLGAPSSYTGFRARSPSAAWWMCCAAASNMARPMWIYFTARRRLAM